MGFAPVALMVIPEAQILVSTFISHTAFLGEVGGGGGVWFCFGGVVFILPDKPVQWCKTQQSKQHSYMINTTTVIQSKQPFFNCSLILLSREFGIE